MVVIGYLRSILNNAKVVRYLLMNHHDVMIEFQKIVKAMASRDSQFAEKLVDVVGLYLKPHLNPRPFCWTVAKKAQPRELFFPPKCA